MQPAWLRRLRHRWFTWINFKPHWRQRRPPESGQPDPPSEFSSLNDD
jgi:hypothetical protein